MSKADNTNRKPTHELFAVQEGTSGKGFWTKIGAAWPHEDSQGFSIRLALLPLAGQSIQLRIIKDE